MAALEAAIQSARGRATKWLFWLGGRVKPGHGRNFQKPRYGERVDSV
jgi:hypothetical protein